MCHSFVELPGDDRLVTHHLFVVKQPKCPVLDAFGDERREFHERLRLFVLSVEADGFNRVKGEFDVAAFKLKKRFNINILVNFCEGKTMEENIIKIALEQFKKKNNEVNPKAYLQTKTHSAELSDENKKLSKDMQMLSDLIKATGIEDLPDTLMRILFAVSDGRVEFTATNETLARRMVDHEKEGIKLDSAKRQVFRFNKKLLNQQIKTGYCLVEKKIIYNKATRKYDPTEYKMHVFKALDKIRVYGKWTKVPGEVQKEILNSLRIHPDKMSGWNNPQLPFKKASSSRSNTEIKRAITLIKNLNLQSGSKETTELWKDFMQTVKEKNEEFILRNQNSGKPLINWLLCKPSASSPSVAA
jgi:gas vesicle protein